MANITITGLQELRVAMSNAPELVGPILQRGIDDSKLIIDSRRLDPSFMPWITGNLARNWTVNYGTGTLKMKPDMIYANAVEYGMPASQGRYVPAIGKRLVNNIHGDTWFGSWPGFKGRFYIEKIIRAVTPEIQEVFNQVLEDAVNQISQS